MKGLQNELENKYPDFKITRNRDGDITLLKPFEIGRIWMNLVFEDQSYKLFKVDGYVRVEEIEQRLSAYLYDMNPAYRKNTATISIASWRTNDFNGWQTTELSKIFQVLDFILKKLEGFTYDKLIEVLEDPNFKQLKLDYTYIPVKSEMVRIAIAEILNDPNIGNIINGQMKDVDIFKISGVFNYKGLFDFVKSLG